MAGESLGTMVVGVTADISPAERALTSMANMLDRFDRQQTSRAKSASSRQQPLGLLPQYGPYTEEQMFVEMLRKEQVQKQAMSRWMFREIQSSERAAAQARQQKQREYEDAIKQMEREESLERRKIDSLHAWAEKRERAEERLAERSRMRVERQQERDFRLRQDAANKEYSAGGRLAAAESQSYFSPMSRGFQEEMVRREAVRQRSEAALRFREIRRSEMNAASGRATEENMRALGEAFKIGGADAVENMLGRTNRSMQQFGDGAARARFAVLNLGYGIQDAAQVFGTSGLAGAIKASANNLQGLGVLLDGTRTGMEGIKAAFFSAEFAIVGVATGLLIAAEAWQKYTDNLEKAAQAEAKKQMDRFDPVKRVGEAGRQKEFEQDINRVQKMAEAEEKLKEKNAQIEAKRAEQREAAAQKRNIDNQEFQLRRVSELNKLAQEKLFQQAQIPAQFRAARRDLQLTKDEEEALKADVRVNANKKKILEENKKLIIDKQEDIRDELFMLDGEKRALEQRLEVLRKPRERSPEEQEQDMQYRLGFLGRTRREMLAASRSAMRNVPAATFESSAAYEALARSRMASDPQSDTLQKILRAEESATKALEDIREKLDPGRRARLAILESLE